jgi:hypothetical protein
VFATVGFGDITATTEAARLVVTGQMIIDLIIIGIGAKIIWAWSSKAGSGSGSRKARTPRGQARRLRHLPEILVQLEPVATTAPRTANAARTAQKYSNGP